MTEIMQKLPEKYQMIDKIRSIEMKIRLATTVVSIIDLLKQQTNFVLPEKTQKIVNGFFNHLTKSCTAEDLIRIRSSWMLTYANVVEDHLVALQHSRRYVSGDLMPSDDTHLTDLITKLTESIALYRVKIGGKQDADKCINLLLERLISAGSTMSPLRENVRYTDMVETIVDLKYRIEAWVKIGGAQSDAQDDQIIIALSKIDHMAKNFMLRQWV